MPSPARPRRGWREGGNVSGSSFWTFLGWLALALNVWGNLLLTSRGQSGWVVRLACNACWVPYSIATSAWALLANHLLFAGINVYGWQKWRRLDGHDSHCGIGTRASVCNCGRLA